MSRTILKRLTIKLPLAPRAAAVGDGTIVVGGTKLSSDRKRQALAEAVRDSIQRNQEALRKLARR